jgi:uncharacterized protein
MFVLALQAQLHLNDCHSLKEKRAVIRPILDGARNRFGVASSEVDFQDTWQRSSLGFATVGASTAHLTEVMDQVERFVWSHPEVAVLSMERSWIE